MPWTTTTPTTAGSVRASATAARTASACARVVVEESTRSASTTRTSTTRALGGVPEDALARERGAADAVLAGGAGDGAARGHHRDERPRGASAGGERHEMARQPR
ncbi:MAG: hypothetical protein PGN11_20370 [Quadrisphaera sp.]